MEFSRYNPVYRTIVAPTAVYLATAMLAAELANVQAETLERSTVGEILNSALAYNRAQGDVNREGDVQEAAIAMLAGGAVVRLCAQAKQSLDDFGNCYQDLCEAIPADCPDEGLALQLNY